MWVIVFEGNDGKVLKMNVQEDGGFHGPVPLAWNQKKEGLSANTSWHSWAHSYYQTLFFGCDTKRFVWSSSDTITISILDSIFPLILFELWPWPMSTHCALSSCQTQWVCCSESYFFEVSWKSNRIIYIYVFVYWYIQVKKNDHDNIWVLFGSLFYYM